MTVAGAATAPPVPDALATTVARQRACLDALDCGVALSDPTGAVLLLNRAAEALLGSSAEDFVGTVTTGAPVRAQRIGWRRPDGTFVLLRVSTEPVRDEGGVPIGVVTSFVDVSADDVTAEPRAEADGDRATEHRAAGEQAGLAVFAARIRTQALYDPLTGLPNRAYLRDRLDALPASSTTTRSALLHVDLDRFTLLNDALGPAAGDELLAEVAARIRRAVPNHELVARIGGDEFAVLVGVDGAADGAGDGDGDGDGDALGVLADELITAIAQPLLAAGEPVTITASVGIAVDGPESRGRLLQDAGTALRQAKERGRNRSERFDNSMAAAARQRVGRERLVRRAIDEDRLVIHGQPIVDLRTGALIASEVLLRILDDAGHLQAPAPFVEVAEEAGLIVPLGARVLDAACAAAHRWRSEDPTQRWRIAVNVSAVQLGAAGFVDSITDTLARHGIRPQDVIVELTESALVQADEPSSRALARLHDLGVILALDDFGTGYSSLAYLSSFPIGIVKLDKSFVAGLGSGRATNVEIVRAVLTLGRSLDLLVVAEGIETDDQLDRLRELGCDAGQGFRLARPVPVDELTLARDAATEAVIGARTRD